MKQLLKYILSQTLEHQKLAETKHSITIALIGAIAVVAINFVSSELIFVKALAVQHCGTNVRRLMNYDSGENKYRLLGVGMRYPYQSADDKRRYVYYREAFFHVLPPVFHMKNRFVSSGEQRASAANFNEEF